MTKSGLARLTDNHQQHRSAVYAAALLEFSFPGETDKNTCTLATYAVKKGEDEGCV